ncbi:MAG: C2 family cysteine protease [Saprospiraceae bacterium]|nr:C2 family cysteine protease [Saprospiraceae bacterium]
MKHVTPDNLDEFATPIAYKKALKKDKKLLNKCKGVIAVKDYKFGGKKKGVAFIFTKKEQEAKVAFKTFKKDGHPAAKLGHGTCALEKNKEGEVSLKIQLKGGGLTAEGLAAKGQGLLEDVFQLKATIEQAIISKPIEEENTSPNQADDSVSPQKTPQKVSAVKEEATADFSDPTSAFKFLVAELKEIQGFVKGDGLKSIVAVIKKNDPDEDVSEERDIIVRERAILTEWLAAYELVSDEVKLKLLKGKNFVWDANERMVTYESILKKKAGTKEIIAIKAAIPDQLGGTVGKGGKNIRAEVKAIQELLNCFGQILKVDGLCARKTIKGIEQFQREHLDMEKPTGIVAPDSEEWKMLLTRKPKSEKEALEEAFVKIKDSIFIEYAVGVGGVNKAGDVKVVQNLLNQHGNKLKIDGICGKRTTAAIQKFESEEMKLPQEERKTLIEPDSKVWNALRAGASDEVELLDKHKGKYDHTRLAHDLFVKGSHDDHEIDETDVQQGFIGNCYFMSAIAAVAKTNPEAIRRLIKDKGDGTYDVTLYAKGNRLALEPSIINVKPDFVTDKEGNTIYAHEGDKELWVMLLEKAYAKMNGGYDDIGEGGFTEAGLEAITGEDVTVYMLYRYTAGEAFELLKKGLGAKKAITAATKGKGEQELLLEDHTVLYQGHSYSVEAVAGKNIKLRNPWGFDHATVTHEQFKEYFDHFSY